MKTKIIKPFAALLLSALVAFSSASCSPSSKQYLHFGFYQDEAEGSALRLASVMYKSVEAKEGEEGLTFKVFVSYGADYLAYPEPVPSLSNYGIAEVAFERLFMDNGLSSGADYVELQRMSAENFERTPAFLAYGEWNGRNDVDDFDRLFFPFTRVDALTLPMEGTGKGFLSYRLHAYDQDGHTVDSPIVQDPLAVSFSYADGKAEFTLIDPFTFEEKDQNRELPYRYASFWPDYYI